MRTGITPPIGAPDINVPLSSQVDAAASVGVASTVIQNVDNDSWLYLENRSGFHLNVQSDLAGIPGGSIGTQITLGGFTVPPLSQSCIPVDSEHDVIVACAQPEQLVFTTSQQGVNVSSVLNVPPPAACPWVLLDHGSFHTTPLYPIERCPVITRRITGLGAGATQEHTLQNFGVNVTLLGKATVTPTNVSPWKGRIPSYASVIVAFQVSVTNLGASSALADIIATANYGSFATSPGNDIDLFGQSAAAANISGSSGIIPLPPGTVGVIYKNTGATSAVSLLVSYWLGIPPDPPV